MHSMDFREIGGDLYQKIDTPSSISGTIGEIRSVLHVTSRIFISWNDRGYDANDVGEICILSRERGLLNFGSHHLNGSRSLNSVSGLFQREKLRKILP